MIVRDKRGRVLRGTEMDWEKFQMSRRVPPLPSSAWTAVNQGGATWTRNADKSATIMAPANLGSSLRIWARTAPATPWTLTTLMAVTSIDQALVQFAGIGFRESSSGKLHTLGVLSIGIEVDRFTSPTVVLSNDAVVNAYATVFWLRILDDGTNRKFQFSFDGFTYQTLFSVARTTHLTADQYLLFVDDQTNTHPHYATFHSVEVT